MAVDISLPLKIISSFDLLLNTYQEILSQFKIKSVRKIPKAKDKLDDNINRKMK